MIYVITFQFCRGFFTWQRLLELAAAVVTLTGQVLGSTTLRGAICYLFATALWCSLTVTMRMWGLLPLNVASAVVSGWTLWQLLV
jgi:hypothetical protein